MLFMIVINFEKHFHILAGKSQQILGSIQQQKILMKL